MEQQNNRKEMYILSLDNGRIFWVIAISLLVLVFLFLLGYWIGRDATDTPKTTMSYAQRRYNVPRSNQDLLKGLNSVHPNVSLDNNGSRAQMPGKKLDQNKTPDLTKSKASQPRIDYSRLSKTETKEFSSLRNDKPRKTTRKKKATVQRKTRKVKTVVRKKRVARRSVSRSTASVRGKYAIQVASHSNRTSATSVKNSLRRSRFRAFVSYAKVKGKGYYRIKVGNFSSYSSAKRELARLKRTRLGKDSFIVAN